MKGAEKRRREIKDEHVGATGKRVFLVEGESDRDAFGLMLEKKFGVEHERKWAVAPAGGKALVIAILGKEFFKSHVCSVLNRHLGQESAEERQNQIFRGLPLPDDLDFLWEKFEIQTQNR